jgi:catechol 2,3-dioxygenase-like lactoylglutathione lyase family enzyme
MVRQLPHLVCTDLRVTNLARSVRFYRLLGLRPVARTRMDDGTRIVWMRDGVTGQLLELFHLTRDSPLYRPFRRSLATDHALIFGVPDLPGLRRRLQRAGAHVELEFTEDDVQIVFLRDADGTWIELMAWVKSASGRRRGLPLVALARGARPHPRG